jgi:hypothetical protein
VLDSKVIRALKTTKNLARKQVHRALGVDDQRDLESFALSDESIAARRSAAPGTLEELFYAHDGRLIQKWAHYLPIYEEVFAPYRATDVHLLEIGVSGGGSLELWRRYFGPEAVIYGIDINPACAERVDAPNQVRIGSQADPRFLSSVIAEMGRVDVILDDGSHVAEHQVASFAALWPRLVDGGLYLIEDLHTAYWAKTFNGGYRREGTAIEMIKELVDDMHGWYHTRGSRHAPRDELASITIFDSIAVIKKQRRPRPGKVLRGGPR